MKRVLRAAVWLVVLVGLAELALTALPELMLRQRGQYFGNGEQHVRFVGDSVTFGYGVPATDSFPALLASANPDLQVENLARPGLRFEAGLKRLQSGLEKDGGGVTVMLLGHNDATAFGDAEIRDDGWRVARVTRWLFSVAQGNQIAGAQLDTDWVGARLRQAQELTRSYDSALVVGTYVIGPKAADEVRDAQQSLNRQLRQHAQRMGLPLVDLAATLPHTEEMVFDAIHLTEAGHRAAAQEVANTLAREGLLEQMAVSNRVSTVWKRHDLVIGEPHPERDHATAAAARLGWLARARVRLALQQGDTEAADAILADAIRQIEPIAVPGATEPDLGYHWELRQGTSRVALGDEFGPTVRFTPQRTGRYTVMLQVTYDESQVMRTHQLLVGDAGHDAGVPPRNRPRRLLNAHIAGPKHVAVGQEVTLDGSGSSAVASTQILQMEVEALKRDRMRVSGARVGESSIDQVRDALAGLSAPPRPQALRRMFAPRPGLEHPRDMFHHSIWQLNVREASLELADLYVDHQAWGTWTEGEMRLAADAVSDLLAAKPKVCPDNLRGPDALGACMRHLRVTPEVALQRMPQRDSLAALGAMGLRRPDENMGCGDEPPTDQWLAAQAQSPDALSTTARDWIAALDDAPETCRDAAKLQAWHEAVRLLASAGDYEHALAMMDQFPDSELSAAPEVTVPALRGRLLAALGRADEAEEQYLLAWDLSVQSLGAAAEATTGPQD